LPMGLDLSYERGEYRRDRRRNQHRQGICTCLLSRYLRLGLGRPAYVTEGIRRERQAEPEGADL
jgi:hypothetical protein